MSLGNSGVWFTYSTVCVSGIAGILMTLSRVYISGIAGILMTSSTVCCLWYHWDIDEVSQGLCLVIMADCGRFVDEYLSNICVLSILPQTCRFLVGWPGLLNGY